MLSNTNLRSAQTGISKISAKNSASEKALRDLIIQKMVLKPRSEMSAENKAAAEGEFTISIYILFYFYNITAKSAK